MKRTKQESKKGINKKGKKTSMPKPKTSAVEKVEDVRKLVHLLQLNQVELEHQNHELRMATAELETSRSKYVNLFDFSPIPYFILDPGGIIKEINLSAAKMFGFDRNKLIGKNINAYILLEEKKIIDTFIKTVFNSPVKQTCKIKTISRDKRVFHVLLEGLKSDDTLESDQRCQIALIDLTEHKKLEDSLKELTEELKLLNTAKDKFIS